MKLPYPTASAMAFLCLSLCSVKTALGAEADVVAMRRAIEELQSQNRALARRLATLEGERPEPRRVVRQAPAPTLAPPQRRTGLAAAPLGTQPDAGREVAPNPTQAPAPVEEQPPRVASRRTLERRVRELEAAKTVQEDTVRNIIQDSFSKTGSKINEFVTLGGAIESSAGWSRNFDRQARSRVTLDTAELDFEVRANKWMVGNLTVTYSDGTDVIFPTTSGFRTGVDRVLVDVATITIGDTQQFPLFMKAGLGVLPFGTSTGFQRLDTLAVTSPISTEVFETRRSHVGIGFEFPASAPTPATPPQVVPIARPLVVNPLISSLARGFGYQPPVTRPRQPTPYAFAPRPPPFYGSVNFYDSSNIEGVSRRVTNNVNATLGYRTGGNCGRPYHELSTWDLCPWTVDVSVDYLSSIFDSRFLETGYRSFLQGIRYIPGVAISAKMSAGPVSLIAEWNGAVRRASFADDAGRQVSIAPAAWQVSLGYQFDWNPWISAIGAQGTYVALSYSGSKGLAGVSQRQPDGTLSRVGFVPQHRMSVTAAEWVLDGAKVALEYSRSWDYSREQGGTGKQADGVFSRLTYVW